MQHQRLFGNRKISKQFTKFIFPVMRNLLLRALSLGLFADRDGGRLVPGGRFGSCSHTFYVGYIRLGVCSQRLLYCLLTVCPCHYESMMQIRVVKKFFTWCVLNIFSHFPVKTKLHSFFFSLKQNPAITILKDNCSIRKKLIFLETKSPLLWNHLYKLAEKRAFYSHLQMPRIFNARLRNRVPTLPNMSVIFICWNTSFFSATIL